MDEPVNSAPCTFLLTVDLGDLCEDSGARERLSEHLSLCEFCRNALGQLSRAESLASRELAVALSKTPCQPCK